MSILGEGTLGEFPLGDDGGDSGILTRVDALHITEQQATIGTVVCLVSASLSSPYVGLVSSTLSTEYVIKDVQAALSTPYTVWFKAALDSPYANVVSAKLYTPYGKSLRQTFTTSYALLDPIDTISLTSQYDIRSTNDISASLITSYGVRVASDVGTSYGINTKVQKSIISDYDIKDTNRITTALISQYGMKVAADITAEYGINTKLQKSITSEYDIANTTPVAASLDTTYGINVSVDLTTNYVSNSTSRTSLYTPYSASQSVATDLVTTYEIDSIHKVANSIRSIYDISEQLDTLVTQGSSIVLTYAISGSTDTQMYGADGAIRGEGGVPALVGGGFGGLSPLAVGAVTVDSEIFSMDISTDEGGFLWQARIDLAEVSDYTHLSRGDEVLLTLGTEQYLLVVDSKSLSREDPLTKNMSIVLVSPIVRLTSFILTPYTYTWEDTEYVSVIAAEIAAMANLTLSWNTVDWSLPGGLLSISEGEPITLLEKLAEAAGATLESNPDGTLVVRPIYPVSIPSYYTSAYDQVYTDAQDNMSSAESMDPRPFYNSFEVGNTPEDDYTDYIEYIEDEDSNGTSGELRVYLYPWREGVDLLNNTPVGSLSYIADIIEEAELGEYIEVVDNSLSTSKPVYDILETTWHSISLGSIDFEQYTSSLSVADDNGTHGLVTLKYRTRYLSYRVVDATLGASTQFVLSNV